MSFDSQLIHSVSIRRATQGTLDDYGQPSLTWNTLATVPARIYPKPTRLGGGQVEEVTTHGGGTSITDHTVAMRPTTIASADRLLAVSAGIHTGKTFEVLMVRDAAGHGHHMELDVRLVEPDA